MSLVWPPLDMAATWKSNGICLNNFGNSCYNSYYTNNNDRTDIDETTSNEIMEELRDEDKKI